MRLFVIAASLAVLSACGPAPKKAPAAEETVAAEPAAMTSANGSAAGTYVITAADGSESTSTINADGTFTSPAPDGSVVEGTWAVVDGKTCFTTKEEGATPECWTETAPGEDGSFTATSDAGDTVTVRPAPAAAPAAEPAAAAEGAKPVAAE
jgi:hypothetical protein